MSAREAADTVRDPLISEESFNDAVDFLVAAAERADTLAEAIIGNAGETDYCIACGCHPSSGHAASCAALGADEGKP